MSWLRTWPGPGELVSEPGAGESGGHHPGDRGKIAAALQKPKPGAIETRNPDRTVASRRQRPATRNASTVISAERVPNLPSPEFSPMRY